MAWLAAGGPAGVASGGAGGDKGRVNLNAMQYIGIMAKTHRIGHIKGRRALSEGGAGATGARIA